MKKHTLLFWVLVIFLCLSVTVCAENKIKFSNDLSTLDMNGVTYSRISAKYLYDDVYNDLHIDKIVIYEEYANLESYSLYTNDSESIIEANLHFSDGRNYSAKYLLNAYLSEYEDMLEGKTNEYVIDFEWPENNTVTAAPKKLIGTETVLYKNNFYSCDYFPVYAYSSDGTLCVAKGSLISFNNAYYYVDFTKINYTSEHFDPYAYDSLPAYKLSNEELIEQIVEAESLYHDDGIGFVMDNEFTDKLATLFFVFLFGIAPLAVAAVYLILSLRASGLYKKLYIAVCACGLATTIIFTALSVYISINS